MNTIRWTARQLNRLPWPVWAGAFLIQVDGLCEAHAVQHTEATA